MMCSRFGATGQHEPRDRSPRPPRINATATTALLEGNPDGHDENDEHSLPSYVRRSLSDLDAMAEKAGQVAASAGWAFVDRVDRLNEVPIGVR